MFYGHSVTEIRKMYYNSWSQFRQQRPLSDLEKQIVQVILDHPDYQEMLAQETAEERTYFPELGETNPFLHMGLHLAIREQVATDRPQGIQAAYQSLLVKYASQHDIEHRIMDLLAECLWTAQKENQLPDEQDYLHKILSINL